MEYMKGRAQLGYKNVEKILPNHSLYFRESGSFISFVMSLPFTNCVTPQVRIYDSSFSFFTLNKLFSPHFSTGPSLKQIIICIERPLPTTNPKQLYINNSVSTSYYRSLANSR